MEKKKQLFTVRDIVIVGLFAAICFVVLYFRIPMPAPVGSPFLHLGNAFVIIAAMLFGGLQGGLAGSIGMGVWDIMNGYGIDSMKTFILKLGIGVVAGLVFMLGKKENAKSPRPFVLGLAVLFLIIGVGIIIASVQTGGMIHNVPFIRKDGVRMIDYRDVAISPGWYIFPLVMAAILFASYYFSRNLTVELQFGVMAGTCGIVFNLIGEFTYALVSLLIIGSEVTPAVIGAAASMPATVINGVFSVVVAVALYHPLKRAIVRSSFLVDRR